MSTPKRPPPLRPHHRRTSTTWSRASSNYLRRSPAHSSPDTMRSPVTPAFRTRMNIDGVDVLVDVPKLQTGGQLSYSQWLKRFRKVKKSNKKKKKRGSGGHSRRSSGHVHHSRRSSTISHHTRHGSVTSSHHHRRSLTADTGAPSSPHKGRLSSLQRWRKRLKLQSYSDEHLAEAMAGLDDATAQAPRPHSSALSRSARSRRSRISTTRRDSDDFLDSSPSRPASRVSAGHGHEMRRKSHRHHRSASGGILSAGAVVGWARYPHSSHGRRPSSSHVYDSGLSHARSSGGSRRVGSSPQSMFRSRALAGSPATNSMLQHVLYSPNPVQPSASYSSPPTDLLPSFAASGASNSRSPASVHHSGSSRKHKSRSRRDDRGSLSIDDAERDPELRRSGGRGGNSVRWSRNRVQDDAGGKAQGRSRDASKRSGGAGIADATLSTKDITAVLALAERRAAKIRSVQKFRIVDTDSSADGDTPPQRRKPTTSSPPGDSSAKNARSPSSESDSDNPVSSKGQLAATAPPGSLKSALRTSVARKQGTRSTQSSPTASPRGKEDREEADAKSNGASAAKSSGKTNKTKKKKKKTKKKKKKASSKEKRNDATKDKQEVEPRTGSSDMADDTGGGDTSAPAAAQDAKGFKMRPIDEHHAPKEQVQHNPAENGSTSRGPGRSRRYRRSRRYSSSSSDMSDDNSMDSWSGSSVSSRSGSGSLDSLSSTTVAAHIVRSLEQQVYALTTQSQTWKTKEAALQRRVEQAEQLVRAYQEMDAQFAARLSATRTTERQATAKVHDMEQAWAAESLGAQRTIRSLETTIERQQRLLSANEQRIAEQDRELASLRRLLAKSQANSLKREATTVSSVLAEAASSLKARTRRTPQTEPRPTRKAGRDPYDVRLVWSSVKRKGSNGAHPRRGNGKMGNVRPDIVWSDSSTDSDDVLEDRKGLFVHPRQVLQAAMRSKGRAGRGGRPLPDANDDDDDGDDSYNELGDLSRHSVAKWREALRARALEVRRADSSADSSPRDVPLSAPSPGASAVPTLLSTPQSDAVRVAPVHSIDPVHRDDSEAAGVSADQLDDQI